MTMSTLVAGLDHPEGVAWDPAGHLVAGGEAGQIYRIALGADGATSEQVASTGGFVLGVALDGEGRAYVCDCARLEVLRVELASGSVEVYANGTPEEPMRAPNHLVFDAQGRLYVSDSGNWGEDDGVVWVIEPGGACRVASREPSAFTNGLAIDPAGEYLYVVESNLPGIVRLPLLPDGALGAKELVVEMPETVPDGIAFSADGQLVIACYRPDRVYVWNGSLDVLCEDWHGMAVAAPTNAAFYGPELERLVVANLAEYHLTDIASGLRGAPLVRPTGLA